MPGSLSASPSPCLSWCGHEVRRLGRLVRHHRNPTIGRFSDMMGQRGGSTVLTEVPEMFGAEGFLMDRCINKEVFVKAEHMINGFKDYFISHNEVVYDNPSPGNKAGGITTLEDKSCGCVQKGGTAPIMDVIGYGDPVVTKGLNMLYGPGNDLVSATAMTAAGAHLILFSTGRGTPVLRSGSHPEDLHQHPRWQRRRAAGSISTPVSSQTVKRPSTRLQRICWIWSSAWPAASRPRRKSTASARSPSSRTAWFCN